VIQIRPIKLLLSLLAFSFSGIAPAHAQREQPVMVNLSDLPSLRRMKQDPAWTEEDTHTAVSMIRKYLTDQKKDYPVDCRFELTSPIQSRYEALEERTLVENRLRRMKIPLVLFKQEDVWKNYPNPSERFQALKPDSPEWKRFIAEELPRIDAFLRQTYNEAPPYGPRGFRELRLSGYIEACPDIQRYLTLYYKAFPSGVECSTPLTPQQREESMRTFGTTDFYINSYKLAYPYAYSYSYRVLTLRDCTFPEKKQPPENAITDETPDLTTGANHALIGKVKTGRYSERRERRKALH
jgi:hypothetical protein